MFTLNPKTMQTNLHISSPPADISVTTHSFNLFDRPTSLFTTYHSSIPHTASIVGIHGTLSPLIQSTPIECVVINTGILASAGAETPKRTQILALRTLTSLTHIVGIIVSRREVLVQIESIINEPRIFATVA
jgi:hypothetical protein